MLPGWNSLRLLVSRRAKAAQCVAVVLFILCRGEKEKKKKNIGSISSPAVEFPSSGSACLEPALIFSPFILRFVEEEKEIGGKAGRQVGGIFVSSFPDLCRHCLGCEGREGEAASLTAADCVRSTATATST